VFFRHGNCTFAKKLEVFNAVLVSKLLYGLESTVLNQSLLKRLDAFLFKGLRKMLHIPTTFVDRTYSNAHILEKTNSVLSEAGAKELVLLSEAHSKRRRVLLAKLVVCGENDPSATATFNTNNFKPHDYGKKRVGRPRLNWLRSTLEDAWEETKRIVPAAGGLGRVDHDNEQHIGLLRDWAETYNCTYRWQS